MKKALSILLILLAAFWCSLNQDNLKSWWRNVEHRFDRFRDDEPSQRVSDDATSRPTPPAPAPPPSTPSPAVEAPPAPLVRPTLTEGTFYTLERITQMTESGVNSIGPGVKVTQVGEENGMLLVDDGKNRVLAPRSKLTNDTIEAATLLQASVPADETKVAKKSSRITGRTTSPTQPDAAAKSARDAKVRGLQAQIAANDRQVGLLRNEVWRLSSEAASARAHGRPSTYNDRTIAGLNAQISALEAQRTKLEYELATLPR